MRPPEGAGRLAMVAAAAVWLGTAAGLHLDARVAALPALAGCALAMVNRRGAAMLLALCCAGSLSGSQAGARIEATWNAAIPEGPVSLVGRVVEDGDHARPGVFQPEAMVEDGEESAWPGPPIGVHVDPGLELLAGERVRIDGHLRSAPGRVRGDPVAGRMVVHLVASLPGTDPWFRVGNAVRTRVHHALGGESPGRALLAGFLIGDTSDLSVRDLDALRRSGLAHFVAVSGTNVALFLAGWWVLAAAIGLGAKRRLIAGLVGLGLFVVVTRWEASVLRAATMAGLALGGAAAGVVVDGWMALGTAVTLLLLVSGQLAVDVGFQLSVAATAGILLGASARSRRRPRWVWATLRAAVSAQVAVVPVLLWHFGTVPLLSPVANLAAAPLVSAATVLGAVGAVTGADPLIAAASFLSGAVLTLSQIAAAWPQLGPFAVLAVAGGVMAAGRERLRPVVALAGALSLAATVGFGAAPSGDTATFLDVGQGDSVLLRSQGRVALVDGGADPLVLADKLRGFRVGRIDLLVVTHGDLDHVGGLADVLSDHGVGRLWVPGYGEPGAPLASLIDEAMAAGVTVEWIAAESLAFQLGGIAITPLGPQRRYAADNEGSIVLWVEAGRSMLLAGDVEAVAQGELPAVRPEILLVPHHGSGSNDERWLEDTLTEVAVVSVGPNRYGHPAPEVMAVLEASGVEVFVTAEDGDVSIDLE